MSFKERGNYYALPPSPPPPHTHTPPLAKAELVQSPF